MSNQWEVVGKKRDKVIKILDQKPGKETNKKKAENINVKVEDVLAKSQVKQLYFKDKNKENKPVEKGQEVGHKKVQKKATKSQEPAKAKLPKSLESALNNIDTDEFRSIFESSKLQFSEAPIVWLKELALYLNQKIPVELQDPVFTTKPQTFPLSVVPSGVQAVIERATTDAGKSNVQLFFDISLTSMATDMSKNLPALGHKILLQYIALNDPSLVVENSLKHIVLRNSYQNRPNIGLSILWAVGQVAVHDFQAGFKVFQDLMLPLIEQKNYSRYVVTYLLNLLSNSKEVSITKEQYLLILETVLLPKKNFPTDLKPNLIDILPRVKCSLFYKCDEEKLSDLVDWCLRKVEIYSNNTYQECLCDVLIECFHRDQISLEHWSKIYNKNVTSSAILLKYIDNNWKRVSHKFHRKAFIHTLNEIMLFNNDLLLKKRKEECLAEVLDVVKKLLAKMTNTSKSRSPYRIFVFMLSMVMFGWIYYDIKQEGSWQNSRTNRSLTNLGVYECTYTVLATVKHGLWWIDHRIEENFPEHHGAVKEYLQPYTELIGNLGRIFYNVAMNIKEIILQKYPVFLQSIDSYAPGLVEQSQNAMHSVWSSSVLYFNRSRDFLKKEVFVGQLSPENMQRVVFEALNTTQVKATEYYHWLYEKVQTTIK